MRKNHKRKQEENKWVEEIKQMSDEDFLKREKELLIKYGIFSGSSFLLAVVGIILFLIAIS